MKMYTSFSRKRSISFTAWNANIIFLISVVLSISNPGKGQVLYGTTSNGGKSGGTITKYDVTSNTLTDVFVYEVPSRINGYLVEASNGKLYGTTSAGGSDDQGTIYSLDAVTYKYTKLKDFEVTTGAIPEGGLVEGADKKLYGTTSYMGDRGGGTIFSFDPSSSIYITLKTFTSTEGRHPIGNLVRLSDGRLYGMTADGGVGSKGVIFSFDPVSGVYTVLKNFDGESGRTPVGSLLKGADGNLYGMTKDGGALSGGVMFSLDPATAAFKKIIEFNRTVGHSEYENLMQANDGKIYGVTSGGRGYGTIFSYDPNTSKYAVLKNFTLADLLDGISPRGSLVEANNGRLYGVTASGVNGGVLFSLDPGTLKFEKVRDFLEYPKEMVTTGSMIKATNGKIIGAFVGGLFTFDPGTNDYATYLNLFENRTGLRPLGSLVAASNGKLYGMTSEGGKENFGVIFYFDPVSNTYSTIREFTGEDGVRPTNNLLQGSDGKLYGTTSGGGRFSGGVLFSLDPVSLAFEKLKDFTAMDGISPNGVIQASNGKLYGMTSHGGTNEVGVIFSYDPTTSKFAKLKDLDRATGYPEGNLTQASNGKLYGVSQIGGPDNSGVLFSMDPVNSEFIVLVNGGVNKGYDFNGKLIQAPDNKLYGLAQGGSNDAGVIFSYDPAPDIYKKLRNFTFIDGANPAGSMVLASDGKLYGSTSNGGSRDQGVLFFYDTECSAFKKILDLQSHTILNLIEYPANPKIASRIMAPPETQIAGPSLFTIKVSPNPSNTNFIVEIQSKFKDEAVEIVVTDISGKRLYQRIGVSSGQYRFGDLLTAGVYFVRVNQGQNIQTLKVIKAGTNKVK